MSANDGIILPMNRMITATPGMCQGAKQPKCMTVLTNVAESCSKGLLRRHGGMKKVSRISITPGLAMKPKPTIDM